MMKPITIWAREAGVNDRVARLHAAKLKIGLVEYGRRMLTPEDWAKVQESMGRDRKGPVARLAAEYGCSRQYVYKRMQDIGYTVDGEFTEFEKMAIMGRRAE